jgi:LmbE family N-acetylglucosaminyl deacetylase
MSNTPTLQPCDVLAFGPHPDDIEIAAAGTLLLAIAGSSRSVARRSHPRREGFARDRCRTATRRRPPPRRKLGVVERA